MAKQEQRNVQDFFSLITRANVVRCDVGNKNIKEGKVVSAKAAKTITVTVERKAMHPLYHRIIVKKKKFYAHDEFEMARKGDVVRIVECRPMSKIKRWRLVEILRHANAVPRAERLEDA